MSKEFGPLLFKEKQIRILLAMTGNQQSWYISSLAKLTDTTYVHTSRFIKKCEETGLVVSEKHGKIKGVKLTEKGVKVANGLLSIMELVAPKQKEAPQGAAAKQPQ